MTTALAQPDLPDPGFASSEAILHVTAGSAEESRKAREEQNGQEGCVVPKSPRAALLAGLVVACLRASLDLGTVTALGQQLGPIAVGGRDLSIGALILFGSLWSGAQSSVISLFFVRSILAALQMTHIAAYTICGGLIAVLYALVTQQLGWDDPSSLPIDCAMGLAAGFFYRLFAGTRQV